MRGLWVKHRKSISGNQLPMLSGLKDLGTHYFSASSFISCRSSLPMLGVKSAGLLVVSSAVQRFPWGSRNIHNFNVIIVSFF
jgi:hypothetical protein